MWLGWSWGAHNPPPSLLCKAFFVTLSKTWHGCQHKNLVSTLCLTQSEPLFEKFWLCPWVEG